MGLALGGSAGARHLARQGLPGSRSTLLRRVRALPDPERSEAHVVGIDDWVRPVPSKQVYLAWG
jgi:hypothetical protein